MRRLAPFLVLAAFAAVAAHGLGTLPLAQDDEAWLAMPGWSFWESGRFGSPAFEGFFGMDRHYYGFLPLFPILLGGAMRLFGATLAAARLVPLAFAVAALGAAWLLARRLLSEAHAMAALGVLALWPVAAPTGALPIGIPMLDLARLARNDVAAAAFALAALAVALPAVAAAASAGAAAFDAGARRRRFAGAGLLAGLAVLGHVHALAFAAAILAVILLRRVASAALPFLGGLVVPLVPYALYVLAGGRDVLDQSRNYSGRVAFSWRFFAENAWNERSRYRPFLERLREGGPAALLFAAAVGAGVFVLWRRRRAPEGLLLAPLVLVPALHALFVAPKNHTYLAGVWPLLAIAAAAGLIEAWRGARRPMRIALAALLCVTLADAARALVTFEARVRETTPHAVLASRLLPLVPPDARVLGMHALWFALGPSRPGFRTIWVPIVLTDPRYVHAPLSFAEAAGRSRPDLVVVDATLAGFLEGDGGEKPRLRDEMRSWLAGSTRRVATVADRSYGTFAIAAVTSSQRAPTPPPR